MRNRGFCYHISSIIILTVLFDKKIQIIRPKNLSPQISKKNFHANHETNYLFLKSLPPISNSCSLRNRTADRKSDLM